jgi:hypothetical protein
MRGAGRMQKARNKACHRLFLSFIYKRLQAHNAACSKQVPY